MYECMCIQDLVTGVSRGEPSPPTLPASSHCLLTHGDCVYLAGGWQRRVPRAGPPMGPIRADSQSGQPERTARAVSQIGQLKAGNRERTGKADTQAKRIYVRIASVWTASIWAALLSSVDCVCGQRFCFLLFGQLIVWTALVWAACVRGQHHNICYFRAHAASRQNNCTFFSMRVGQRPVICSN